MPNWKALYEIATPRGGYFTFAEAESCGMTRSMQHHHVTRGRFVRVARGVMKFRSTRASIMDTLMPVYLQSGERVIFARETAYALHGFLDTHPKVPELILPVGFTRWRGRAPDVWVAGVWPVSLDHTTMLRGVRVISHAWAKQEWEARLHWRERRWTYRPPAPYAAAAPPTDPEPTALEPETMRDVTAATPRRG